MQKVLNSRFRDGIFGAKSTRYRANEGIGQFRRRHPIERFVNSDDKSVTLRRRQDYASRHKPALERDWIAGTDYKAK